MDPTATQRRVSRLFPGRANRRTCRVALEHELLSRDAATGAPVEPERVRRVLHGLTLASRVTFEPGGQVEVNLPPLPDATALAQALADDLAGLRGACDQAGIALDAIAVDPRRPDRVPLQLESPRYVAMQRHFDGIGPAGRRMMRRTASTQLCLDWWPGRAGLEQWRVLLLSGPFLAAAFDTIGVGSRLATWLAVDPDRTAFDGRLLAGDDPVAAYTAFAQGAATFTTSGDIDEHLTTLFPPIRPRGRYLEVRHLDVQPEDRIAEVASVFTTLVYDDALRRHVLAELEPERDGLAELWRAAAAGDPDVTARGAALVAQARTRQAVAA